MLFWPKTNPVSLPTSEWVILQFFQTNVSSRASLCPRNRCDSLVLDLAGSRFPPFWMPRALKCAKFETQTLEVAFQRDHTLWMQWLIKPKLKKTPGQRQFKGVFHRFLVVGSLWCVCLLMFLGGQSSIWSSDKTCQDLLALAFFSQ